MTAERRHIDDASLRVSSDYGHGGAGYVYGVRRAGDAAAGRRRLFHARAYPSPTFR
jgi:hypothetical protein